MQPNAQTVSCSVLDRLRAHRAQMAPHQKDRNGGRLILDSITEIERLQKCKTSLQIIHTWATFQGGRALVPEHVENLTTKTLAPFSLPNA